MVFSVKYLNKWIYVCIALITKTKYPEKTPTFQYSIKATSFLVIGNFEKLTIFVVILIWNTTRTLLNSSIFQIKSNTYTINYFDYFPSEYDIIIKRPNYQSLIFKNQFITRSINTLTFVSIISTFIPLLLIYLHNYTNFQSLLTFHTAVVLPQWSVSI